MREINPRELVKKSYAKRVQLLTFFLAKQSILVEFMSDSVVNRG